MEARYIRNLGAITEADCDLLRQKTVLVVGCGGLGGYLMEYLARIGIGTIRCVDGDVFDETNLNRQILATTETLGKAKVQAAADRLRVVNPDVAVQPIHAFLDQSNAGEFVQGCHMVLDALDNIPTRRILADVCAQANIPYVFGAISGWVAQAGISMPGDRMIQTLYPDGIEVKDKSVLSFTPAMCAALQASLCVSFLLGHPVETGKLHYFDLFCEEYEKIPIN